MALKQSPLLPVAAGRLACAVCGAGELKPGLTLARFPVFQGCVNNPPTEDEQAPMSWVECPRCRSAQIAGPPPLARVYPSGITRAHLVSPRLHARFAAFLARHAKGAILELGEESGALAAAFRRRGGAAPWTILDPLPLMAEEPPADVAQASSFLKRAALTRTGASTIVLCHMLERARSPRAALADLAAALPDDGRLVIAWPVLERLTEQGLACALSFEHPTYMPLPALKALLARTGLRVYDEELFADGDSLFLACARATPDAHWLGEIPPPPGPLIADYFTRFRAEALSVMRAVARHKGDAFLMPASIGTQALIAAGLTETRLSGILDNDAHKRGARLCGTTLSVHTPAERLAQARSPLVILTGAHDAGTIESLRRLRPDVAVYSCHEAEASSAHILPAPRAVR